MPYPFARIAALLGSGVVLATAPAARAEDAADYLNYVRDAARTLRADDRPPTSLPQWQQQRADLRALFDNAFGDMPATACPLEPRILGELRRDGYRVEKVVFQTMPGVWMTANAYVPSRPGKLPAVLAVHGHWPGAKQDPVVQARCIGLAQLGFFVLAVDAFGAGERAVGKALGEYHGDMTAATLLPSGLTLSGVQRYENWRAIDYLLTRPEVDGTRLGVTGASGGGNQTMYAGAFDERITSVVPVCSVGNYQAYLGVGCCLCEVVPGALSFTEEGRVLGMIAPRPLLVINASRDSVQFSIPAARVSLGFAEPIFALYDRATHLRHATFDSPHAYSAPMRETMYGWMSRHLQGAVAADPIKEPELALEQPETLRCFPGDSRPQDYVTLPRFAAARMRELVARADATATSKSMDKRRAALRTSLFGRPALTTSPSLKLQSVTDTSTRTLRFEPEPLLTLTARLEPAVPAQKLALVLDLEGGEAARKHSVCAALRRDGWTIATLDIRATGKLAVTRGRVGRAPDHHPAEWALWLGRPLLGQWVTDVQRTLDAVAEADHGLPKHVAVIGVGPAGLIALAAGALESRVTHVAAIGPLASYVSDVPYEQQWLGLIVPGIVRDVGDVAHIAALIAPRPLTILAPVHGNAVPLNDRDLGATFAATRRAFEVAGRADACVVRTDTDVSALVERLR